MSDAPLLIDLERGAVVVFDTDCVLCSRWVHFLLAWERRPTLVFVRAWSATGRALAARHGLDVADLNRTYLLIEKGRPYLQSAATLALLAHLRAPWCWLGVFTVIPAGLRDRVYRWVADNRYTWFGRKDDCFVPPPPSRDRFIQD